MRGGEEVKSNEVFVWGFEVGSEVELRLEVGVLGVGKEVRV